MRPFYTTLWFLLETWGKLIFVKYSISKWLSVAVRSPVKWVCLILNPPLSRVQCYDVDGERSAQLRNLSLKVYSLSWKLIELKKKMIQWARLKTQERVEYYFSVSSLLAGCLADFAQSNVQRKQSFSPIRRFLQKEELEFEKSFSIKAHYTGTRPTKFYVYLNDHKKLRLCR